MSLQKRNLTNELENPTKSDKIGTLGRLEFKEKFQIFSSCFFFGGRNFSAKNY